ncbi:hypothetical protein BDN72DRAFT_864350 [Pluteus cervinus]|uniref:Uncharacterized protein n=1 Tax=Pluteus cervinus TaxID=181527 RepID=A0ACD3A4C2_9AGAR|nr:hypothetical protein BDN72DRAFT_864350 [Pluteus cervinus]
MWDIRPFVNPGLRIENSAIDVEELEASPGLGGVQTANFSIRINQVRAGRIGTPNLSAAASRLSSPTVRRTISTSLYQAQQDALAQLGLGKMLKSFVYLPMAQLRRIFKTMNMAQVTSNFHQYDRDADDESEEPLKCDSREAFVASKMIRIKGETYVNPEVPPNGLKDAQKPTAYSCYLLRSAPTPIAPAPPPKEHRLVEYDTSKSASPVSTVTVHPPIASPREGQKLSRSIGEVEVDSSEDEPLIKRSCYRRSNDERDEEQVEEPADDEERVEEPADDDDDEGMVGVDEAPAACGAKSGGSNFSEGASSNSEEDELDERSDSSASGIRWKGNREDRRKAEEMYQTYLESNNILFSAYKTLNDELKQKFEAENPRESIPLPSCLCKVLRDDMSFLPEAACASAELTMEILLGDNDKVKCLTHWWRRRSSSNLAKDCVGAYKDGVEVVDCGCSVDVMLWEFFLLKTFKLAPPHTAFPLLPYNSRDGMTAAIMELLGITRTQELFNSNGTGWHDPQHQKNLKKQRLASLMADLGQDGDIKGKKEESPGPLDNVASSSSAPVRPGASSLSRSARSVVPPEAPPSTPIRKKLRSAKAMDKRKAG